MTESGSLLGHNQLIKRLTDADPQKRLVLSPLLSSSQIQPASIDVRLGPQFKVIKMGKMTHLEPLDDVPIVHRAVKKYSDDYKVLGKRESFILHPGEFVLGSTLEYVGVPQDLAARIEGRSSWGRLGILIHATAGYVDPNFRGNITVELANVGKVPVPLYPGIRIGQLSFFSVAGATEYRGKYNETLGLRSSHYFNDYEYSRLRISRNDYAGILNEIGEGKPIAAGELPPALVDAIREYLESRGDADAF